MKESMASSNDQTTKSAALSLVGKEVIVTDKDSASGYYSGKVGPKIFHITVDANLHIKLYLVQLIRPLKLTDTYL